MVSQPTRVTPHHDSRSAPQAAQGQAAFAMLAAAGRWLSRSAARIAARRRRRAAIRQLERWSPHMLADIGLSYGSIPAAVDGLLRRDAAGEAPAADRTGIREPASPPPAQRLRRRYDAGAVGLQVVHRSDVRTECC
ncbi:MAG: DUF1127 domain-containing protein [Rhodospirillaceae bacterium]|nr:DUF1127 domain-containing protein [Rhodospirillaceae bacterium]